jgi:hypothetical protein
VRDLSRGPGGREQKLAPAAAFHKSPSRAASVSTCSILRRSLGLTVARTGESQPCIRRS